MGQRHEALVQHREAADPRVEDGDRKLSIRSRHGRLWSQDERARRRDGDFAGFIGFRQ
jgi:hypothetical protein